MDTQARITEATPVGEGYYRLKLQPDTPFASAPGQFVMVRGWTGCDPLLRRPFSIHRADLDGSLELLFREVGKGTNALARLREGDRLMVLGPLGRGFDLASSGPLLVGGGIGVAPLLYLAERFLAKGVTPKLLLGGRADRDILCHDEFSCLAVPFELATEDGSLGEPGLVTGILERELSRDSEVEPTVYSCGPLPMLAAVKKLCDERVVRCQLSLEAHMACGVGACLGCVVPSFEGKNLRVCKEGPVFESCELRLG